MLNEGRKTVYVLFVIACVLAMFIPAWGANYDESKVPEYTLPDPLVCNDGTKVTDAATWRNKRRAEVLGLFEEYMFGKAPDCSTLSVSHIVAVDNTALEDRAIRKQVSLLLDNKGKKARLELLVYLPKNHDGPVPVFVGLNFKGNHTITADPGIYLNKNWMRPSNDGSVVDNRATETSRGTSASRWAVEMILARGYGLATMYYGDIDPDFDDGYQNGMHPMFYRDGQTKPAPDEWVSIAAWAWGLSRIMDYFEIDADIDHEHVAVLGHSRLGKTSLWAGATDERFALVISNNSGCGGAALSRRAFGETVARINTSFPHWFCDNFKKYNDNEGALPMDQHMLIALMAPRPVYVASAVEDRWADPRGEYLSARGANDVYKLFGLEGLPAEEMPDVDKPAMGMIGYHIRSGGHDVKDYDWQQYLDFADKHFKN